jgi:hypothetical protein
VMRDIPQNGQRRRQLPNRSSPINHGDSAWNLIRCLLPPQPRRTSSRRPSSQPCTIRIRMSTLRTHDSHPRGRLGANASSHLDHPRKSVVNLSSYNAELTALSMMDLMFSVIRP